MGLIAFMHDYEFVRRLRFFVLQTSEHFVPTLFSSYTSSSSFLPSKLEFTLVLLLPSPTTTERIFFLFVPLLGSSRLCSATTHSLTRSLVLRSTRPRALPPPLSFRPSPNLSLLLFRFLPRHVISSSLSSFPLRSFTMSVCVLLTMPIFV